MGWERITLLATAYQGHPVADGENDLVDPLVVGDFGVELSHRDRIRISLIRVCGPTKPKHVIEHDQATGADQTEGTLIVAVVFHFVGIDEGKIESIDRLILEPFQGIASRSDHDLDLFRTPARSQWGRPILAHSSFTSQVTTRPFAGNASATANAL